MNKGISIIEYNSLNLPQELAIKNTNASGKIYYTYSASGVKLKTVHLSATNQSVMLTIGVTTNDASFDKKKTTDYVGNMIYENGTLKRTLIDGGYVENNVYHFYLTDHLGNNRVVAKADGTVMQKNHYYPFDMAFTEKYDASGKQPFKYNGKELDSEMGLNTYDYSARTYEPAYGRFMSVDPLAEKYYSISPYVYCLNNPLKYIDPLGMDTVQRNDAVRKAEEFVAKKESGNQYLMGAKGKPGEKVDCSGLVSKSVIAGGEKDPNYGNKSSGVLNIENNTHEVDEYYATSGNIVTFRTTKGYPYHTGIVKNIVRDKDGNITTVTYIHSSGGKGPNESTINIGSSVNLKVNGYYKWDNKPDLRPSVGPVDSSLKGYSSEKESFLNKAKSY